MRAASQKYTLHAHYKSKRSVKKTELLINNIKSCTDGVYEARADLFAHTTSSVPHLTTVSD